MFEVCISLIYKDGKLKIATVARIETKINLKIKILLFKKLKSSFLSLKKW